MAESNPKTSGTEAEAAQGAPVWGTIGRVLFILVAGTGLFYLLGQMTSKIRGIEQEAKSEAQKAETSGATPPRGAQTAIPDLPRLSPYPNAISYTGGDSFLLNGVPRRIATLGTHDRPDVVTAWYANAWKKVGLEPFAVESQDASNASATDLSSNLRYSVMAQWIPDSRMTIANVSVSTVAPIDTGFEQSHLPLPEGSTPLMDVRSEDAGASGAMVAYLLPLPTGAARTHMLTKLRELGWKYEENYSQAPDERGWCVMFFSHGPRLLTLTLDPAGDGRTSMVVNESEDLQ